MEQDYNRDVALYLYPVVRIRSKLFIFSF